MNPYQDLIRSKDQLTQGQESILDSDFSRTLGTKKLGIHWVQLPPGQRSSHPHAESFEEEVVYVVSGRPHAWINGFIYELHPGHCVGFPAGTGIAHCFINNTKEPVEMITLGERTKTENRCSFPINPELFETHRGIWWSDPPRQKLGPHDGLPGNLQHQRSPGEWPFIQFVEDLAHKDGYSYPNDTETFSQGVRLTNPLGLKALGLWHEILEPGKRSAWPHAHKIEEEFALILKGHPKMWLNGFLYELNPGDGVFFPPGTNIAHVLMNESEENVQYLGIGQAEDLGSSEKIYYPLHQTRNEDCKEEGWLWEDRPAPEWMGPHSGIPKTSHAEIRIHSDPVEFLQIAGPLLYQKEVEYSLLLGLCELKTQAVSADPACSYFSVFERDQLVGAAMKNPKNLMFTSIPEPLLKKLIDVLRENHLEIPGVVGPSNTAEAFAKQWAEQFNLKTTLAMAQKIYQLKTVLTPSKAPGRLILATMEHADLIAQWLLEFSQEALPHEPTDLEKSKELAIAKIQKSQAYLWLNEKSNPVSMNLVGRPTRHGISVSGVYTPRHLRKKGYASAVTAGTSQTMLDSGKEFCVLYTDLSNPTSNRIYQNLGYQEKARSKYFQFHSNLRSAR